MLAGLTVLFSAVHILSIYVRGNTKLQFFCECRFTLYMYISTVFCQVCGLLFLYNIKIIGYISSSNFLIFLHATLTYHPFNGLQSGLVNAYAKVDISSCFCTNFDSASVYQNWSHLPWPWKTLQLEPSLAWPYKPNQLHF